MMRTSRRDLIRLGAAAAVACFVPEKSSAAARVSRPLVDRARGAFLAENPLLTRTVLGGQIDTPFRVDGTAEARGMVLRLRGVADLPSAESTGHAGDDLCFSAIFGGPARLALRQQTYTLRHATLGTFSVFLVPVGRPGKERSYEATFNRIEA